MVLFHLLYCKFFFALFSSLLTTWTINIIQCSAFTEESCDEFYNIYFSSSFFFTRLRFHHLRVRLQTRTRHVINNCLFRFMPLLLLQEREKRWIFKEVKAQHNFVYSQEICAVFGRLAVHAVCFVCMHHSPLLWYIMHLILCCAFPLKTKNKKICFGFFFGII